MNHTALRPSLAGLLALGMLGLQACATVDASADYDKATDFTNYHTYRILDGKLSRDDSLPGAPENTIVKDRIRSAIDAQLQAKGLRPDPQSPDLLVGYVAGARTRQEIESMSPYDPMLGAYWNGWWGPSNVYSYDYQRGTLIIDLIDAGRKKLVWRGVVEADRDKVSQLGDPQLIQEATGKAFENFPPAPGK